MRGVLKKVPGTETESLIQSVRISSVPAYTQIYITDDLENISAKEETLFKNENIVYGKGTRWKFLNLIYLDQPVQL